MFQYNLNTCSQEPATFSHLPTIPVTSTPGWFHSIKWASLPSPSATCKIERRKNPLSNKKKKKKPQTTKFTSVEFQMFRPSYIIKKIS